MPRIRDLDGNYTSVPADGAVEQTVLSRTVTLTDAQIKALPTTRQTIVPAPGAGQALRVVGGEVVLDASAGAYDMTTGRWALFYGNTSTEASGYVRNDLSVSGIAADHIARIPMPLAWNNDNGFMESHAQAISSVENKSLDFYDGWASGDYTGGNAANSMKVTAYYVVLDL